MTSWPAAVCSSEQLQYASPCYFFPIPHELSEVKGDVWGKIALFYLQCFPVSVYVMDMLW